jgi:methyl-accepting chemotaxis protein
MTHKICGPLVNFTTTFKKIGDGDFSRRVILRKGDYLKVECDAINGMIEGLSNKFQSIADEHERVIGVLEGSLTAIADDQIKKNIESLLEELKEKRLDMAHQHASDGDTDE